MTNEEAINLLHDIRTEYCILATERLAIDIAIAALEQKQEYVKCGDCKNGLIERQWIKCGYHNIFMRPDDSCSKGTRRAE